MSSPEICRQSEYTPSSKVIDLHLQVKDQLHREDLPTWWHICASLPPGWKVLPTKSRQSVGTIPAVYMEPACRQVNEKLLGNFVWCEMK